MNVLLIILLILSVGAIFLLWLFFTRVSDLSKKVSEAENAIGYMKADIDAQRKNILDLSAQVAKLAKEKGGDGVIKKITYDAENDTVKIDGNLFVTGWVAAEMIKED